MDSRTINIRSIEEALRFIQITEHIDAGIYIIQGHHTVSAKSLLGILSLDLSKSMTLEVHGAEALRSSILTDLKLYLTN